MFIKITGLLLLLLIGSIPLFLHIDSLPFRLWDESRLASNAYEMHKNGNFIVTYYDDQPEMWNTKPPLMIWMQVFFIKLIGFTELAVRLPSAIAGLLTCAVLVFFSLQYFKNLLPGAFACMVLVTTNGYIDTHAIRTGDYDGLLALFTTIVAFAGFLYAENNYKKWLILFFVSLTLAVLTKSVQPLLFLPGIVIYFLFIKKMKLLFSKSFLTGVLMTFVVIAIYYITRELMNSGYLLAIWDNELGGRYFNALEENDAGALYYISRMEGYLFPYWIWLLPIGIISGLFSKDEKLRRLTIFTLIVSATYFLFITISKTKLYWYTVPLFPLLSIQIGIFLYQVYGYIKQINLLSRYQAVPLLIVSIVFVYPYYKIFRKVYHPKEYEWDKMYPLSGFLQDAYHGKSSMDNVVIVYRDYDQHLKVYTDALKDKGQHIYFKQPDNLSEGDTVMASESGVYKTIELKYDFNLIKNERDVKVYLIKKRRRGTVDAAQ